jgi:hypothetical protein
MPVARQSPRAPAILRPCVDVLLLSFGILSPKFPIALVLPLLPLQGNQGDVILATQPPQKYVKYDKTRGEYPMQEYTNLGEAIMATQPIWLITYLYVLVAANLGAVFFIAKRTPQGWRPRYEAIAIIVAFLMAGEFMDYLYAECGYVRLLGFAHIMFWTPVYVWIFIHREDYKVTPDFAKFVSFYLVMVGISLLVDFIDVVRYLLGETGSMI